MKLLFLILLASLNAQGSNCQWPSPAQVILDSSSEQRKIWTANLEDGLFSNSLPDQPDFVRFRSWVHSLVNTDPIYLLKRQRDIFANYFGPNTPDVLKMNLVLSGQLGQIRPISCLEALLMAEHTSRFPLERNPTEFLAVVLQKQSQLKVYFISHNKPDSTAPDIATLDQFLSEELSRGWSFLIKIHNHPFILTDLSQDIAGTLVPSGSSQYGDVQIFYNYMQRFQLNSAWITNGFDSIRLDQNDINLAYSLASE